MKSLECCDANRDTVSQLSCTVLTLHYARSSRTIPSGPPLSKCTTISLYMPEKKKHQKAERVTGCQGGADAQNPTIARDLISD